MQSRSRPDLPLQVLRTLPVALPEVRTFIDALFDLLIIIDRECRIVVVNQSFGRHFGCRPGMLAGRSIFDILGGDRDKIMSFLRRASMSRQPLIGALTFRRADGTDLACRCDGAALRFAADGPWEFVMLHCRPRQQAALQFTVLGEKVDDLTREIKSRQKGEERLRELNGSLEQRVSEEVARRRDAELALHQAQKLEAIGQLTGGVAHDFNNLLTVIIGNLETIRRDAPATEPQIRRAVTNALRGALRAAELTERLLAFARLQPLAPKRFDVNKLAGSICDLLRRTLVATIRIEAVLAGGLWPVKVDPAQLESAILNLAFNARDAMPDGGRLTIETANCVVAEADARPHLDIATGQYVVIAVSDTGRGMSPEVIGRAFEPFFTTKGTGEGTGLGLSQVYGFVKQSDGYVKILSESGIGTMVKIYLPRIEAGADEDREGDRAIPTNQPTETVLLVEDDGDVREYSSEALRELGYIVIEAQDGPSALRIIDEEAHIDLLLTDVVLPSMNGRELAEEARRRRPRLKVLFTTGYSRNAFAGQGRLDPGIHLLNKPFTYAALATKLREVLD